MMAWPLTFTLTHCIPFIRTKDNLFGEFSLYPNSSWFSDWFDVLLLNLSKGVFGGELE